MTETQIAQAQQRQPEVAAALKAPEPAIAKAHRMLQSATRAYCTDEQSAADCVTLDKAIQQQIKAIEDERKSIVDAALAAQRAANGIYHPVKGFLEEARKHIQAMLIAYRDRKDEEAKAAADAERKAAEERALADAAKLEAEGKPEEAARVLDEGADLAQSAGIPAQTGPVRGSLAGTASIGKRWNFKIVNPDAVPRAYCTPDERLIRKAMPKHPAPCPEIAGVEWIEEDTFANR
jgi:tetratricopeptide (TPR) repeat protein